MSLLSAYGWDPSLADQLPPGTEPGRVLSCIRDHAVVVVDDGTEIAAEPSGKFYFDAPEGGMPVAGDWVALTRSDTGPAVIHALLARRTAIVRKIAGARTRRTGGVTQSQVVAANVDTVVVCTAVPLDVNLRRLERYLATVWESGAVPVVAVTKADMLEAAELAEVLDDVRSVALGVEVVAVSALDGTGLDALRVAGGITVARTLVFIGSSGVGKSTLVNALAGVELMDTGGVRVNDGRGRHTTTRRQLLRLPDGSLIIDTPGIRELELWSAESGLDRTFDDLADSVDELAAQCRFGDCAHGEEPGCAVRAALEDGTLSTERYESWRRLQREQAHLAARQDARLAAAERNKWKRIAQEAKRRARP